MSDKGDEGEELDPRNDPVLMRAVNWLNERNKPGEDPLYYHVEEDAQRGVEGEPGEAVYVPPREVVPVPVPVSAGPADSAVVVEEIESRRRTTQPSLRKPAPPAAADAGGG